MKHFEITDEQLQHLEALVADLPNHQQGRFRLRLRVSDEDFDRWCCIGRAYALTPNAEWSAAHLPNYGLSTVGGKPCTCYSTPDNNESSMPEELAKTYYGFNKMGSIRTLHEQIQAWHRVRYCIGASVFTSLAALNDIYTTKTPFYYVICALNALIEAIKADADVSGGIHLVRNLDEEAVIKD